MGSLTKEQLDRVLLKYPLLKDASFIETGTYKGHSSSLASGYFSKVKTVEIHRGRFEESKERFLREKLLNVEIFNEDSSIFLKRVLNEESKTPLFVFLDAHQSGSDTGNNGVSHVPLLEELRLIKEYCTHVPMMCICIDDCRLWNVPWDWKGITEESVLAILEEFVIVERYEKDDKYWIFINGRKTTLREDTKEIKRAEKVPDISTKDVKTLYFFGRYPINISETDVVLPEDSRIALRYIGHPNISQVKLVRDVFNRLCLEVEEKLGDKMENYKYVLTLERI